MKTLRILVVILAMAATSAATQWSYSNSGGTVSQTNTLSITGTTLASPAGTVSMTCPLTYQLPGQYSCLGGSFSANSSDGTFSISGTFTSGLFTVGSTTHRGVTYYFYSFSGNFAGSQTINGKSVAVAGSALETLATMNTYLDPATGTIQTGIIDVSQQWEPVYIADTGNNRIVESADILGSNWASIGKLGAGVKQFSAPWGVALDSAGKIYVSDSGNCRIVRMNNIAGASWTSFGSCGSGTGQFSSPKGLWVDSAGKIYVADSGNNRLVRMDDMTGTNWTALGTMGSGTAQFNNPAAVTTDSAGNIYVADNTNCRVVEFSDMLGTNWAVWQFPVPYVAPNGVAVDSAGKIYLTDSYQNQVIRGDNISGANSVTLFGGLTPAGIFLDPDGAVYVAFTANNGVYRFFDYSTNDVFIEGTAGNGVGNLSAPHAVVAMRESKAMAVASLTPPALTFPTEVVGTGSPVESTVLTNIGNAPLTVSSVASSSADYPLAHNCPATLAGGQNCSAAIFFRPTTGGLRKGTATFKVKGAVARPVPLSGSGALISASPTYLILYEGAGGQVTVTNPLNTATAVTSVQIYGPFGETNNCGALAPGASCTINITWGGIGVAVGELAIKDSSGTITYVGMTGE